MDAKEIYNMGIDKFNELINQQTDSIKINCTALEYVRTLIRMYAEADGDYYKCCGSDIYNNNCRLSYFAVCTKSGTTTNGKNLYRMLPGGFSLQSGINTLYRINFTDIAPYLLCGNEYNVPRTITTTVKSVTGNVANKEYMSKINHVNKMKDTASYVEYAKEAECSEQSSNAILADGLSDKGFNIVVDKFIDSITCKNTQILDLITKKLLEKQRKENHIYKCQRSYTGGYKIKDIYNNETVDQAMKILKNHHRILIMGNTGDGKTSLAYMLANKLTKEDIGEPTDAMTNNNYYRICIASAGDGNTLWELDDSAKNLGKLRLFVEHIRSKKITQPCVFICNEIQVSDLRYLIGSNLFEEFSNSKKSAILPENLYLIFTGCVDSDFGIDAQVTQRVTPVMIKGIREKDTEVRGKLAAAFKNSNNDIIFDTSAEINSIEGYSVITMRKLIQMLKEEKPNLAVDMDSLSNKSKKLLERLREYYDN